MPLGTLDRNPPPLFRQGVSAFTQLALYSAFALFLMVADTRLGLTGPLRNVMATALLPVDHVLAWPGKLWGLMNDRFAGLDSALARERAAQVALLQQAERLGRMGQLEAENQRLRALLALRPAVTTPHQPAELLFEAADPYTRKVVIDRGSRHGVAPGSPVITEAGVYGQVSRVHLYTSEVTLVVDRDAAIPVINTRTQHRAAAFGGVAGGLMELQFVAANDDVRAGDALVTSGLDGVYPPGLAVASVLTVDRHGDGGFARITLAPAVKLDAARQVLVLEPINLHQPSREAALASAAASAASAPGKRGHTGREKRK